MNTSMKSYCPTHIFHKQNEYGDWVVIAVYPDGSRSPFGEHRTERGASSSVTRYINQFLKQDGVEVKRGEGN